MSEKIVQLNEEVIKGQLKELVRGSVEETLNELLEAEAEKLTQAARYERNEQRQGYRSGHYNRNLTTTSGDVTLKMPKLKGISFETAIIERYRRRESSVEEVLIEMYLAGVSVRRVEDITEALWGSQVSPATISELNKKASREKAKAVVAELRAMKLKEATKKVEDSIEETLTYCDFPGEHWTSIRTNNVIERLNHETGMTVILITHHMDEAARADRVIAMSEGRIVADGTPQAVFAQEPLLRSVGLDVPQTEQLLLELKRRGIDIPTDALTPEACAQLLQQRIAQR